MATKELNLIKSENGWEYQSHIRIGYKNYYKLHRTVSAYSYDHSESYDTVEVDGVFIYFDEQFELQVNTR